MEDAGIALLYGQDRFIRRRIFLNKQLIEGAVGLRGIILARNHFGNDILRDGKEVVGGNADVHVIFFNHGPHLAQRIGKAQGYILTVAQGILSGADKILRIGRHHDLQHPHGFIAARLIVFQLAVQRNLKIRRGHQPFLAVIIKKRHKNRVQPLIAVLLHTGGVAKIHSKLLICKQLCNRIVVILKVAAVQSGIGDELLHPRKHLRPYRFIQPHTGRIGRVGIRRAPLHPCGGGKRRGRQPLQCFHAGVIVGIIRRKAAHTHLRKRLTGSDKAVIVSRQRNIVLFKQAAVDNKAVRIGAYRQPVNAAVLIHIVGEIVVVDCARLVGHSEIHQAALERRGIMQREAAAGDNVRQTAVFLQEFIEIQIVMPHDEFNIHIGQLGLDIGRVGIVEVCCPQVDLYSLGILFGRCGFCAFCTAAGQQRHAKPQHKQQGKQAAPSFLFHSNSPSGKYRLQGLSFITSLTYF